MKRMYILAIIILVTILPNYAYAEENDYDDVIIVGVHESRPYYEVDANGNVSGYYHDLLTLLQKKYNLRYKYVVCDFSKGLSQLKEGKIDLMFGVSVTSERLNEIIYNREKIATEIFALFSNNSKFNMLSNIEKAKIGLVKGTTSAQFVLDYFSSIGVNGDFTFVGDWVELEKLFEEGKVDIITHNIYMEEKGYHKIYEFSGDQVYIAANKNNKAILDSMDKAITELSNQKDNQINELYKEYFGYDDGFSQKEKISLGALLILISLILIFTIIPILKKNKVKEDIRLNMHNDNFLLQYQPIYNPRNRSIVGFEGLLRLLDKDKNLLTPFKFISVIEDNNMLFEVSLWILDRVIKEYEEIKQYDCVKDKDFYISINVSLNEIENKKFVYAASELLEKSKLGPNKICLEIIERIKVKDLSKVAKNLKYLKQAGFKIAIDDFGTEYSNLDLLLNLDTNIIKIDKCFVEGIDTDEIKKEVINFVSQIAKTKNKDIVLEGVEQESEAITIKSMEKDLIYVQGYYYSKPLFKKDIEFIH